MAAQKDGEIVVNGSVNASRQGQHRYGTDNKWYVVKVLYVYTYIIYRALI